MGRLIYTTLSSRDGFVAGPDGSFDWARPDEEVHRFVNTQERAIGTYLYGRRLYETMRFWEDAADLDDASEEYAGIWRAADKVVYSTTLPAPVTARTRLERDFDPEAVRAFVAETSADVSIGGPTLAVAALRAGIVDEIRSVLVPAVVGGGTPALPVGLRASLRLVDHRSFEGGAVYLAYDVVR